MLYKLLRRAALYALLLSCTALTATAAASDVARRPGQHAIASAHPAATAAGREVIEKGGNAFDAAIAVAAALAVVEPYSSGIGGGGFFLLHLAQDGRDVFVDARETAPAAATADMYHDEAGEFKRELALNGPLAAGIPGLPAALAHLAERYAKLPLADSLAPAVRLAREGFETGERYAVMAGFRATPFAAFPEAAEIFLHEGLAPPVGHRVVQNDLATTLESIGADQAESFYRGELAAQLVAGVREAGGIWTTEDLAQYRVTERPPIVASYHDIRVVSAPPPSSGGVVLVEALNILERYDLESFDPITRLHVVIEAMRRAYRDRADYLGDPDFTDVPVARLTSKDHGNWMARDLELERATLSTALPALELRPKGEDTTHFSVLDADGNRVAATLSINYPFGALMVPPGTGVLLNNEMDDFSARPMTPNVYGLVGTHANAIAPGKRPLSSMTPTFLETDDRIGVIGTPGGSRIISMVLIGALEYARGRPPFDWVNARRFHHQYLPDEVQFEKDGFNEETQTALTARGHVLKHKQRNYGNMQAILWDLAAGTVDAASDPRGEGAADVW